MITRAQLEEGNLVLRRTYAAGIDDVWVAITQSDRLARWYEPGPVTRSRGR